MPLLKPHTVKRPSVFQCLLFPLIAVYLFLLGSNALFAQSPDLVIQSISTTTGPVAPNAQFTLSNTVKNQGTGSAGASVVAFSLSTDNVYGGANDIAFTTTRNVGTLAAGATSAANTSLTIPATAPIGNYYVCAKADHNNAVTESNEGNNASCTPSTISVAAAELIITQVTPNASTVNAGATLSVTNATQNTSSTKTGTLKIGFRLSINTVYGDSDDVVISTTRTISSLNGGASSSATTNIAIPGSTIAGIYYVCAKTDSQSQVTETNENNNTLCSTAQVTVPADLTMTALSTTTTTLPAGATLVADNTAKNQSGAPSGAFIISFHLSIDAVYGGADDITFTTTRSVSSLAIGASSAASTTLTVPTTTPGGSYYLCAMADSASTVVESIETNNTRCTTSTFIVTRPTILNLNPNSGPPGTPVVITGTDFGTNQGSSTVTFNGVSASPTSWSSTSIAVPVPATATTGPVIVTVDGLASNSVTFTVGFPDVISNNLSTGTTSLPAGNSFFLNNTVTNQGVAAAGASVTSFVLSTDNSYGGTNDIAFTNTQAFPVINGGGNSATSTRLIVSSITPPGNYYVCAKSDSANQVTESNETNNAFCTATTIAVTTGNLITYVYDELGRLRSVTDPSSDSATYNYDAVGNLLSIQRQGFTTVTILEFTPNSGPVGTPVTIFGSGFSTTASQNTVKFNGVTAVVTFSNATQITTSVPASATTGVISVTSPSGTANSGVAFTVTTGSLPSVSGFTPANGSAGAAVTINGSNFETILTNNTVRFNASTAIVSSGNATSLSTTVPTSATSGKISVATPNGTAVSSTDFIIPPIPYLQTDIQVSTRIPIGTGTPITVSTVGKIALALFDGTAGQNVNIQFSSVTIPSSAVSVLKPDGTTLVFPTKVTTSGTTIGPLALTSTGTYTIVISLNNVIFTFAGRGQSEYNGDSGQALLVNLKFPEGVASSPQGNVYISEPNSPRVRKVDTATMLTKYAGGALGYSGDGGLATDASLQFPVGVAVDTQENVYWAEWWNGVVRKVLPNGIISTYAGNFDLSGSSGDGGPATSAAINQPWAVAADSLGNVYIVESNGHKIRKVNTSGIISTFAGTGVSGFSGDTGQATNAKLSFPRAVWVDALGNVFIADSSNSRIRKVNTSGVISTVAGNGTSGTGGDGGQATSASVGSPQGIASDAQGNLYISHSCRIRMVNTSGIITTLSGSATCAHLGVDGPAERAQISSPKHVSIDSQGNLYVADTNNLRVKKIILAKPATGGSMTITVTTQ